MKWVDNIFSFVWDLSDNIDSWADSIWTWIPGASWFQSIMYDLSDWLWSLLPPIANFGLWADDVWEKAKNILTSEDILGLIKEWFPKLSDALTWFSQVYTNIKSVVELWWTSVSKTVGDWIALATEGLAKLKVDWSEFWTITWKDWVTKFELVKDDWSNFVTKTLPTLFDVKFAWEWWKGRLVVIETLIDQVLREWFPQYNTEEEQRPMRVSFFLNPLNWLADRLESWFWGEEEP